MVNDESYEVPEGLYYSKDFIWVKNEADKVRIGLTDFAQKRLREIVYADLPNLGDEVKQGESCGSVESVKAVTDIVAPVSGTITEVNNEVLSNPEILNDKPYTSGWLLVINPSNLQEELSSLMDFEKSVEWHKAQST
ncbi:MAG: glycine cleavage system protein GcvH [Crenarchaeota archaeon]|nr:glycine cleavage system protein GcvH [Thermoproteota archaeon]